MIQTYKKRIFVETEYVGANVSCISTKKGLVLIDSPFLLKDAEDWARRIRELTGQDIVYLINTDHHFDHVMGNAVLTDNVICHSTAAKGINFLRNKQALKQMVQGAFPDVLVDIESDIDNLNIVSPLIVFDKKLAVFQNLEDEVKDFELKGLTIEQMVKKSKIINFFPNDEIAKEDLGNSWIGEQYKSAVRVILAENKH